MAIAIVASSFQIAGQPISLWVSPITAGVYVDRWSKKAVLVISNLVRGLLVLSLPWFLELTQNQLFWQKFSWGFISLLGITLLVSSFTQFFAPAEQAVIPLIIKPQNLLAANSLYTTTMMALLIVGFAIGEPLLDRADSIVGNLHFSQAIGKEILVGSAYLIAGIILIALQTQEKPQDKSKANTSAWQDIRDGINYLKNNRQVRNALLQLILLFSVFAALVILAVSIADQLPNLEADEFGILLATTGIGMGISAAIVGGLEQKFTNSQLSLIGSVGVSASLFGLSLATQNLSLTLIMTASMGSFAALIGIPMQTTIQAETPSDMRGKVFGLQNNAVNIALSLPLVLAAQAEAMFGLRFVIIGLAVIMALGAIISVYSGNNKSNASNPLS